MKNKLISVSILLSIMISGCSTNTPKPNDTNEMANLTLKKDRDYLAVVSKKNEEQNVAAPHSILKLKNSFACKSTKNQQTLHHSVNFLNKIRSSAFLALILY